MQTLKTSKGRSVISPYTTNEAREILRANFDKLSSFGQDISRRSNPSHDVQVWIHILAVELTNPKPAADAPKGAAIELKAVLGLLTSARSSKLKNPSITFEWNGRTVELALAGSRSKRPGTINVTDGGPFGSNTWYGRINLTGVFEASRSADADILNILTEFNDSPAHYAAEYGRKTGRCCFCNLHLTDSRSTAVGYGSTCAKHYGLPWGAAAADEAIETKADNLGAPLTQNDIDSGAWQEQTIENEADEAPFKFEFMGGISLNN